VAETFRNCRLGAAVSSEAARRQLGKVSNLLHSLKIEVDKYQPPGPYPDIQLNGQSMKDFT
jgi:hypothetical protein